MDNLDRILQVRQAVLDSLNHILQVRQAVLDNLDHILQVAIFLVQFARSYHVHPTLPESVSCESTDRTSTDCVVVIVRYFQQAPSTLIESWVAFWR